MHKIHKAIYLVNYKLHALRTAVLKYHSWRLQWEINSFWRTAIPTGLTLFISPGLNHSKAKLAPVQFLLRWTDEDTCGRFRSINYSNTADLGNVEYYYRPVYPILILANAILNRPKSEEALLRGRVQILLILLPILLPPHYHIFSFVSLARHSTAIRAQVRHTTKIIHPVIHTNSSYTNTNTYMWK